MFLKYPEVGGEADYGAPVIATIDALQQGGLNRDDLILDGSGILALFGIRPAEDVDFIVKPSVFDELHKSRQIPDGNMLKVIVGRTERMKVHLQTVSEPAKGLLPLDMKTFYRGERERQFELLKKAVAYSDEVRVAHFSLDQMLFLKTQDSRRRKDRVDGFRIAKHMGSSLLQASWLALGKGNLAVNS